MSDIEVTIKKIYSVKAVNLLVKNTKGLRFPP